MFAHFSLLLTAALKLPELHRFVQNLITPRNPCVIWQCFKELLLMSGMLSFGQAFSAPHKFSVGLRSADCGGKSMTVSTPVSSLVSE